MSWIIGMPIIMPKEYDEGCDELVESSRHTRADDQTLAPGTTETNE